MTVAPGKENTENRIAGITEEVVKEYLPNLMMDRL